MQLRCALAVAAALILALSLPALAADEPGESWTLAYGGKLYDSWWEAQGADGPARRHPAYPDTGTLEGADTWRCVACHGWDYKGPAGNLLKLAGTAPARIAPMIRGGPHGFTYDQIPDDALMTLTAFISEGLHDTAKFMDAQGKATGSAERGRGVFEGICASCHQLDGMAFISAEPGDQPSLGWVARQRPAQALHKIRNGQPGADMVSVRFMDNEAVADLFAYVQGLDPDSD